MAMLIGAPLLDRALSEPGANWGALGPGGNSVARDSALAGRFVAGYS